MPADYLAKKASNINQIHILGMCQIKQDSKFWGPNYLKEV